jgi:hypothetical protein
MNFSTVSRCKYFLIFGLILVIVASCKKEDVPETVLPGEYLPAYPGSYWDYSDGSRSRVEPQYAIHSYRQAANSVKMTNEAYVPVLDGQYLYEYSVWQSSPVYPLKKLLSTSSDEWIVDENNNVKIYRQSKKLDSLVIAYPGKDSVFKSVIATVEFMGTFNENNWSRREFYAKNVGLIRVEINNPYDTLPFVVEKEIRTYFINH